MKFTCTRENISHVLDLVGALAGKHTNLPILMNVLFVANESGVEVLATNLEMAVRASLRAKVETPGSFTVPAKTLSDYVHLLSDEKVSISLAENELIVECGSASTKIKGVGPEEYPVIPGVEEEHAYVILAEDFRDALGKTAVAVAKNEIRPELSGVYFGFFTERYAGLLLAATDSYRLAEKKVAVAQGKDLMECIVPARTVYEMMRLISLARGGAEGETQVRVWASSNQLAVRFGGFEMTSRLVDGKYPDYAQIIPTAFKTTANFPTDVMVKNIKAASLFTMMGVNAVSFDVRAGDHTISVSSTSTQTGEHTSEIDSDIVGEENSILLNHRYVLDGLQHLGATTELQMNSADAPCLFRAKGTEDYVYIVMPIRQ